jgi:uncharacterized protein (UPF0332 family)
LTPEAAQLLESARQHLAGSKSVSSLQLWYIAGREAYLAAFHAAEALIYERTGKIAKTHAGLRSRFAFLARSEPEVDQAYTTFLAEAYELKSIADYSANPAAGVSADDARAAIDTAERFVECIAKVIA